MTGDEMPDLPDPLMQFISGVIPSKQARERRAMDREVFINSVHRMIAEMELDHLLTLRHVLNVIDTKRSNFVEGLIVGQLEWVRQVCADCGKNHDAEILAGRIPHDDE